jgi:hypothetical protein
MTIFDYKHYFVNRKWLWTAITRATDLNNIWFYDYSEEVNDLPVLKSYFKKKIEGYKQQDKKDQRKCSDNYVSVDWLMKCVNKPCQQCGCNLEYNIKSNVTTSNITAQRIDNSQDHNLNNIVPMCRVCNCSLSNKF